METKYTMGPWRIGLRTAHSKRDVYGPQGELVALADGVFTDLATAQANARLIAAAPDLAEALQDILLWAAGDHMPRGISEPAINALRKAGIQP